MCDRTQGITNDIVYSVNYKVANIVYCCCLIVYVNINNNVIVFHSFSAFFHNMFFPLSYLTSDRKLSEHLREF